MTLTNTSPITLHFTNPITCLGVADIYVKDANQIIIHTGTPVPSKRLLCTCDILGDYDMKIKKNTIKNVIFANPATIVEWDDGTKTVVTLQDNTVTKVVNDKNGDPKIVQKPVASDNYDRYTGLALCVVKKVLGNKSNFSNLLNKWIEIDDKRIAERKAKEEKHSVNVKRHNLGLC